MTEVTQPAKLEGDALIEDMIDNPTKYGFDWGYGHLLVKGKQVTMGKGAPRIEHINAALITAAFGDTYLLESANGQSARVRDQTLRDELSDNIPLRQNDRGMKRWVLEKALGLKVRKRTVVTETVYQGLDKQAYKTQLECDQANIAYLVDKLGVTADEAKETLGL